MKPNRSWRWLLIYQSLAGCADTSTGLLLLFAPARTLRLMGLHQIPLPPDFASFVGVFVLSVGIAYLYAAALPLNVANAPRWQTVWLLTALTRSLVALFLIWKIAEGRMEIGWVTVALSDGALALTQWIGLSRGWLDCED